MLGAILAQLPVIFIVLRADWRGAGRSSRTRALLLGGGAALLAMPAVAGVAGLASRLQERFTGRTFDPIAHETLRMIVEEPGGWSALLSALAITGAPLAEEVLYRGLGHDLLRRLGLAPWSIIGAVSILFALAHWSVATGPALAGLFVLGLALGWSRERSGSLLAPIIGHALFNAVNLWLAGS
jgi:membrane protease YdiL (CAAX protease family)